MNGITTGEQLAIDTATLSLQTMFPGLDEQMAEDIVVAIFRGEIDNLEGVEE